MLPDWFVCSKCGKMPPEVREFHFGDEVVCSLCESLKGKGDAMGEKKVWRITFDTSDHYKWLVIAPTVEDAIRIAKEEWIKDRGIVKPQIFSVELLGEVNAGA